MTYAQNLDLHLQQEREADPDSAAASRPSTAGGSSRSSSIGGSGNGGRVDPPSPSASFYQPEPTLLDIASGGGGAGSNVIDDEDLPPESRGPESVFGDRPVRTPPPWVPDAHAPNCMGCSDPFTLFRRRHHCRYVPK